MAGPWPHTVAFAIRGPILRSDLPGLCDRVCGLLRDRASHVVLCDVTGVCCDAVTVEALARLDLAARRCGCRVRLCNASAELLELVSFMGLADVLRSDEFSTRPESLLPTPRERRSTMARKTSRQMFVNLAVKDLDRSVEFFTELGFSFDERFTDETATCMLVGQDAYVMLLVEGKFDEFAGGFGREGHADPATRPEAFLALSAGSREEVDALTDKALESGGSAAGGPMELGFMYGRSFNDPDGHLWEVFWMDPAALEQGAVEAGAASS